MADLATTKTVLSATGAAQTFTAGAAGVLVVKLWGGGGAGGMGFAANSAGVNRGGGAGYTYAELPLVAGQTVRFDVGRGGQGPQYTSGASGAVVGSGGAGGWPDGGDGGVSTFILAGGGGGSSRVWVDGSVEAVAGGGGGQGQGDTRFLAGAGGGATGQTNSNTLTANNFSTGGSQTAGGVNQYRNDTTSNGAFLQGGHGYGAGGSRSVSFANAGGGGGGGYYGGAGGGVFVSPNNLPTSGAGGSGFVRAGVTGATTAGARDVVAGTTDIDYAGNAGLGGLSRSTPGSPITADNGTDGRIVYIFVPAVGLTPNTPATVSPTGALSTYTVSTAGKLAFKLWGGGGGGGSDPLSRATGYGGSGGFADGVLTVAPGDVIKLEVGGGGARGVTAVNAAGGWPDGGNGAVGSVTSYSSGAGGGSTRIYLNDVLMAVAGGGGGGSYGTGGPGGGLTGGQGFATTLISAPGGTQTAGGSSSAETGYAYTSGAFLQGGRSAIGDQYTGGGGGGGYYGGAAGSIAGSNTYRGGGGGSGFLHGAVETARNLIGSWRYPAVTAGAPAGTGQGGATAYSFADNLQTAGGAGYATLELITPVTLTAGTQTLAFTGKRKSYVATAPHVITGHLWGGAGAGGTYITGGNANRKGGAGGYTAFTVQVKTGDVVRFEVGEGGKPSGYNAAIPTTAQAVPGGVGGWPDAGIGGRSTTTAIGFGGGGGSTRLYINDVLAAVAGGGGGATGLYFGGNGGGAAGLASTDTASGGGGTQTAGGVTGTGLAYMAGTSLRGGNGVYDQTLPLATAGAGGGGGYFGGGSNGGASGAHGSGGGGSGYINPALLTGSMQVGANNTGTPFDVAGVRVAGVAVGGNGAGADYSTTTAGGDGQATFTATAISPTTLTNGSVTTVAYTGARVHYTVSSASYIDLEMWGGGGGGGFYETGGAAGRFGGAGGYTKFRRLVMPGDLISVEVAQGGRKPSATNNNGGLGGWPNGGLGGRPAVATNHMGGGGGSTNVYINGILAGVASGGGGSTGLYHGGNGGGLAGLTSTESVSNGLGGTQFVGGNNRGAFMLGGTGGPTGDAVTIDALCGAGGGGGYYGGGGARGTTGTYGSGGGGSGFSHGLNTLTEFQVGAAGTGMPYSNAARPAGVGQGGVSDSTLGATTDGGDGAAVITVTTQSVTSLPADTTTTLTGTGSSVAYTAASNGVIFAKMWGGGGGGAALVGGVNGEPGGTGGYATVEIPVLAGQVVRFDVGRGGQGAQWSSGTTTGTIVGVGGNGGWPDGGAGGYNNRCVSGGGGGSSRIWIDGVLYAVAAGGGGDGIGDSNRRSGSGGGLAGQDSTNSVGGFTTGRGTGGTQTAGGVNLYFPTDAYMQGGYLRGGRGFGDGASQNVTSETSGGGGGGGYYGGGAGGGGNTTTAAGGGAGGSSYIKPTVKGFVDGGNQFFYPGGQDDIAYTAGIGAGGTAYISTTTPANAGNGADGRIIFNFASDQTLVSSTKTTLAGTGRAQRFVAPTSGVLKVKMWGGGGSAGIFNTTTNANVPGGYGGGCGGFTYADIEVKAGQVVQFDVAMGGGGGTYVSGTSPALVGTAGSGGWPDGGNGGFVADVIPGGGGGSSRVWVDGVLKAVAGGGGGASGDARLLAGAGGGLIGQATTNTAPSGQNATGGTQGVGGINNGRTTDIKVIGGLLRGGHGYNAGGNGRTTDNAANGYGGGGGYYGGGGGGQANRYVSAGGGGSSYLAPEVAGYTLQGNFGFNSGGNTDPDYVTNVGKGSTLAALTNGTPGYAGSIIYTFTPATTALTANVDVSVTAATSAQSFTVPSTGNLSVRLWGAGGGGSTCGGGGVFPGAGGGYTEAVIPVVAGQVVRFDVAKGGQGGRWTSGASGAYVGRGGDGGWPDGGIGGFNVNAISGGGGGSTRVWVDGALVAVAAGGGGSAAGITTQGPGAGGGLSGGNNTNNPTGIFALGGTQTLGGVNQQRTATDFMSTGRRLRGGAGFAQGQDQATTTTISGGGGGGGYYGGGGGGAPSTVITGGAGGSSYIGPGGYVTPNEPATLPDIFYASFDAAIEDDLGRVPGFTQFGAPILSPTARFGAKSLYLNGSSHVSTTMNAANSGVLGGPGTIYDFTIEGWWKNQTLPTGGLAQVLFTIGDSASSGMALFQLGSGLLYLRFNAVPSHTDLTADWKPDTEWNHWAVSRKDGITRVFKNGVLLITQTTVFAVGSQAFNLGAYSPAGDSRFNGWIDGVRVSAVARYTEAFTPPTEPPYTRRAVTTPLSGTTLSGTAVGVSGGSTAPGYVAGIGAGGTSRTSAGNATDGGDGLIIYNITGTSDGSASASGTIGTVTLSPPTGAAVIAQTMPAPGVKTNVAYTGSTVSYAASVFTQLDFELWGGGGGGVGVVGGGGGGGYTTYSLTLQAGDIVTVQTASGGASGVNASDTPATLAGGYPDGGTGRPGGGTIPNAGGGGSSRVFVNGVLVAVAGGAGGGFWSSSGNAFAGQGGPGGGLIAEGGKYVGASGNVNSGAGGTQSAGGLGGNGATARSGGYLLGGDGGASGPGGGGGYYGGGGGLAGGGGSGYFNTAYSGYLAGSTTGGSGQSPAGTGSANYVAGVGVGSGGGATPGGPGRIVFLNNTPTPGNAAGALSTVTVTPPIGGVDAYFPTPRDIATVTVTAPVGQPGISAEAVGLLPTVVVNVPSADPRAQAIVTVPINNSAAIAVTPPLNEPFSIPGDAEGELTTIVVTPPLAQGQVPNAAEGDIGTIIVSTVDGEAESNLNGDAVGDIGTITLTEVKTDVRPVANLTTVVVTVPTGVPHGGVLLTDDLPTIAVTAPEGEGTVSATAVGATPLIYVEAPEAVIITDVSHVYAPIRMVRVLPPEADLLIISDDNFIVEDLPGPITITEVPLAEGGVDVTGAAHYIVPAENASNPFPEERYMFRILPTPPQAFVEASAEFEAYTGDFIVLVSPPQGVTDLSADIVVSMPAPIVINGGDAEVSVDVSNPISDNDIVITPPGVEVEGGYGVELPTVTVLPPEGSPSISANASGDLGTITLENPRYHYIPRVNVVAPEGEAVGYASASVEASMPPPIVVSVMQGGSQSSATVSLPLPQIFVLPPEALVVANAQAGGAIGTIVITPPAAQAQVPGAGAGDLATIVVTSPEGVAGVSAGANAPVSDNDIVVTPPLIAPFVLDANATGAIGTIVVTPPLAQGQVPGASEGDIGTIVVTSPEGHATTGAIEAAGDIGTILVTSVDGVATGQGLGTGGLGTIVVTPPRVNHIPQITVVPPQALAGVAADASGDLVEILISPPEATVAAGAQVTAADPLVITVTPPIGAASAGVDLVTAQEITVLVVPPQATLNKEANVVVGFPTVYVYAPTATALSLTEFDTIRVTPPDAYVDVPLPVGKARIRYKRTTVRGRAPASLFPREINLNETDGVLFSRDADGDVVGTPLARLTGRGLPPVATLDGQVLAASGSWAEPLPIYSTPIRNAPPAGERIALADGVVSLTSFTPTVGALYTRPFFVARTIDIAALSVEVLGAAASSAQLAIIGWSLTGVSGATLVSGVISAASTGVKQAPDTAVTLSPGWYAATFQVTGAAGASFRAATAPATVSPALTSTPATPACVMADLEA